jgi:5-methylcytosine-specific restriction endonuclease McrA
VKAIRVRRRGRQYGSPSSFTLVEVMRVFALFGRRCAYCEQPITGRLPDPDHVVPLSRGGSNSITNILPSCHLCNSDKRDLLLAEWNDDRARRGLPPRIVDWPATDVRVAHLTVAGVAGLAA